MLEVDEIRSVLEAHAIGSMSEWDALDAARAAGALVREQTDAVARGDAVAAADGDDAFHRVARARTRRTTRCAR